MHIWLVLLSLWATALGAMDNEHSERVKLNCNVRPSVTQFYHWFPYLELMAGGDPINNLYAKDGILEKLDRATGRNSRQYELEHYRLPNDSKRWKGHDLEAAIASCILTEPKKSVTIDAKDGSLVTFSPEDIKGLIIKVINHLVIDVENNFAKISSGLIYTPESFIQWFSDRVKDSQLFVGREIAQGCLWHYSFDKVIVHESTRPPANFTQSTIGNYTFYRIEIMSTAYDSAFREYQCYVVRDYTGSPLDSGWISKEPNGAFWVPKAMDDLSHKSAWIEKRYPEPNENPYIDLSVVYDIYMQSL